MLKILQKYTTDTHIVTEYTKDGINVSHTSKVPIPQEVEEIVAKQTPTLEDILTQLVLNTEYLVALSELEGETE